MTQSVRNTWTVAQQRLIQQLALETNDAKFEAQLLLQSALKVNRAWLLAHEQDVLPASASTDFEALLTRRLAGEPVAYILGYREFYGLNLKVSPDTLIPRPDTETLVEAALAKIPTDTDYTILDLGTGTGAVALAIAQHRPHTQVTAVDASQGALHIAEHNAQQLGLMQVHFNLSHWFSAVEGERFNLIVSNPPYIEQHNPHLSQGDLRFEPISALASGEDGLDDIREIIAHSLIHLQPQGWLMLEHGYNQAHLVADLMAESGLVDIETIKDLGANDRVTIGKNPLIVSTHWD